MLFTKKPHKYGLKMHSYTTSAKFLRVPRKPPVTKDKGDKRKRKKICQPRPVRGCAIKHDAPVAANRAA